MAFSKRQSAKTTTEPETIIPISEVEAYRQLTEKIDGLIQQRGEKSADLAELQSQRKKLSSHSLVDRLTTKFLSGASPLDESSYSEKIAFVCEEIKALDKAIQVVQRDRSQVRNELSTEMRKAHFTAYRLQVRQVLAGMFLMERGNQAILALRETLDLSGYTASTFVPAGLCPWPFWGEVRDGGSRWRAILTDMRDGGFIDADEFEAIVSGDLSFTA